ECPSILPICSAVSNKHSDLFHIRPTKPAPQKTWFLTLFPNSRLGTPAVPTTCRSPKIPAAPPLPESNPRAAHLCSASGKPAPCLQSVREFLRSTGSIV